MLPNLENDPHDHSHERPAMPAKRPIELEDLFRLRVAGRVAISPDGRHVVFELKRFDYEENRNFCQLMIVEVGGAAPPRPLTEAARHSDTLPKFAPDGSYVAFLSDREKPTCLWLLPMDGGEPRRITGRDGNVRDFDISPDGRRIACAWQPLNDREKLERDKKSDEIKKIAQYKHITRLAHKLDGAGYWNGHYTHVYVADVRGGKPRQLTRGDYDDSEPRFSPDGRLVSFVSNRDENPDLNHDQSAIYVVPAGGGALRRLTPPPGESRRHSWSPDGSTIVYLGSRCKPRQSAQHDAHVWAVDARGGKPRRITTDIDNNCENMTIGDVASGAFETPAPIWSADSRRVYFLVSEHGATRLYSRSLYRRDTRCEIGGDVSVMYMSRTAPDGPIAVCTGDAVNPADVYVLHFAPRPAFEKLTSVNAPLLGRVEVVAPEAFWLKARGLRLHAWVLRPPGFRAGRKYPAILQIHGGPQAQYGQSFMHEMQWMAAKGYVVAYCNPRGSSGYGLEHRRTILGRWGTVDYQDVKRLADWLFSRPYVDRKRVGVTGGSYGGFMTNWIVGHETRFRAAVTQRSCVNFESFYGASDIGWGLGDILGGDPWRDPEPLRRQSPLRFARNIRTPLLIIHSEQDLRCPVEQAQQLFVALKCLGREVEYVQFEGESHGLSRGGRPKNRAERLRRIVGWFDRHLKP